MTTQELKQYIDKVLGNNIRCLLPSYWWKRLFSLTLEKVDEKLDATNIKTINGESIVGEGNLKVGVTTVGSIDELNTLEASFGDIATVGEESTMLVSVGDLPQVNVPHEILEKWDNLTRIVKVEFGEPVTENGRQAVVHLNGKKPFAYDTILITSSEGGFYCGYGSAAGIREITIEEVNEMLKKHDYRFMMGSNGDVIDRAFKLHAYSASADAYIKSDSWDKLSKEYVVSSEEELNALSVEKGTIATATREAEKFIGVSTLLQYEDGVDYNSLFKVKKVSISVPKTSIGELSLVYLSTREGNVTLTIVCSADGKDGYIQAWYEDGRKVDLMREQTLVQSNIDDLNSYLSKNVVRYISAGVSSGSHFEFIDTWFKVATPYTVADAYIKGDSWERLAKEGENGGGSVIFSIPLSGDITDITENQRNRNIESYQKVIKAFEDNIVLDIKINQLFISNVSLYVIDVNKNIVAMVFNRDNSVYTYRFSSDGNFTREIEEGSSSGAEIREFYIGDSLTDEQKAWNLETAQAILDKKAIVICNGSILGDGITTNNDGSKEFINSVPTPQGVLYTGVKVEEDGTASVFFRQLYLDDKLSDKSINAVQNKVVTAALNNKVDKVSGKQLSTEDFTTALKTKLEGLSNYDDTSIQNAVNSLTTQIDTLVSGDASVAIENFNEIISFLNGIEDSESLDSIIASIEQQIANKQNIITDLTDIRNGAALGKTALQSIPTEYVTDSELIAKGYATTSQLVKKQDVISDLESIRSGAVLGTTSLQEHQDISHLATKESVTNLTNNVLDNEEIYAAAVNDLNIRVVNIDSALSTEISNRESLQTEFQIFKTQVTDNEEVWATSLTDINTRIDNNYQYGEDTYTTKESLNTEIQTINTTILDNEEVIAATLTDLNNQIASLNALITDLTNRIETLENA